MSEHDLCIEAQLKPSGELRCQHVIVIARTGRFMLKTILQLQLSMRRKTVGGGDVDPGEVLTPTNVIALAVTNRREELLVPANRAE